MRCRIDPLGCSVRGLPIGVAKVGIEALYRTPSTSRKHPKNKVHPYLLRGLKIARANRGWARRFNEPIEN